ncbi:MAG: phosphomethylpyrimidine synthase ThiC, partial [Candidatus Aenigmarchaeota archaeon]|nr:phosphomethylpyrimidine synthase ThiC [Candidatus Aenigmarchaeota archaeon]
MTTQLERARGNEITKEIEYVAKEENVNVRNLIKNVAEGYVVVPA